MANSVITIDDSPTKNEAIVLDDSVEVVSFEDFLSEKPKETLNVPTSKRKRNSDGLTTGKKKQKVCNNAEEGNKKKKKQMTLKNAEIFEMKSSREKKQKSLKKVVSKESEVIEKKNNKKVSNSNTSKPKNKSQSTEQINLTREQNKLRLVKNNKLATKKVLRKSSSDGIADIETIKEATNPERIPSICRTPIKIKRKKNLTEAEPLKNECVLWTDKYAPKSCKEVLGKSNSLNKLNEWLAEWKKFIDKEKLFVERKKNDSIDSDEDFQIDDCEKDEEDILCNTLLINGPAGCGKTAAIYACAGALGFKVIEMNSSSVRGKNQIISQLHEATQSHQVSKQDTDSGIKSFFKPKSKEEKMSKTKDKRLCLVLLEEVEILYEDDKFFWAGVQTLMSTSKRPIVLTSNKSDVVPDLEERFETLQMKLPSNTELCRYLTNLDSKETSSLTTDSNIMLAARFMRTDTRKSINALHFWTGSVSEDKPNTKKSSKNRRSSKKLLMDQETSNKTTHISCVTEPVKDIISYILGVENLKKPCDFDSVFSCMENLNNVDETTKEYLERCIGHLHMHHLPQIITLNWDNFLKIIPPPKEPQLQIHVEYCDQLPDEDNESSNLLKLANGEIKEKDIKVVEACSTEESDKKNICSMKVLDGLSKLLDCISFSDILHANYLSASDESFQMKCEIDYILDDDNSEITDYDEGVSWKTETSYCEIQSYIQMHSLGMCQKVFTAEHHNEPTHTKKDSPQIRLFPNNSRKQYYNFANTMQSLFNGNYTTNFKAFVSDMLPSIRCISRSQDDKERSNHKRRFLHYFNTLSIHPSDKQLKKLVTDFTEVYFK